MYDNLQEKNQHICQLFQTNQYITGATFRLIDFNTKYVFIVVSELKREVCVREANDNTDHLVTYITQQYLNKFDFLCISRVHYLTNFWQVLIYSVCCSLRSTITPSKLSKNIRFAPTQWNCAILFSIVSSSLKTDYACVWNMKYTRDRGRIWFWEPKSWSFWHGSYGMGIGPMTNVKVVCKAILNEFSDCKTEKWRALR